jgi:glycosyl transferase family 25
MLEEIGIDKIYVVHVKQGYELHEQRINKIFKNLNLDYEFVTDGDVSNFNNELLGKYFCEGIESNISKGAISCTLNHILIYKKIIENNYKSVLVFENDIFLLGDFIRKIKRVVTEANSLNPGFIISLENTTLEFPEFRKIKKGKVLYQAPRSRCSAAYLIDVTAAKKILENLKIQKCCQVIDWWFNTLISNNIIKMYWAHPPFIEQGSHNGLLSSKISNRSTNIRRRLKWKAQKFYKMYIYRWFKKIR